MVTTSILLTVFNRAPEVLKRTLESLLQNNLDECEIVIVDDGSTDDFAGQYTKVLDETVRAPRHRRRLHWHRIDTKIDHPETYSLGGYNNPAYAFLSAARLAQGQRIVFVSSDCIVPPGIVEALREVDLSVAAYHARVLNSTGQVFCGGERIAPYGWFFALQKSDYVACGEHDLNYLKGMSFEDNDFTGRVLRHVGRITIDLNQTVIHQDHENHWADDGLAGWKINEAYTREKWGGKVPFSGSKETEAVPYHLEWANHRIAVVRNI
jgi:glycosyltransferase involved in cell wall biosynthesis